MRTGSLRIRAALVTLAVLTLALGGFATAVTVRYSDGLETALRSHLAAGARAVRQAPAGQVKQLVPTLALEGINLQIAGIEPPAAKRTRPLPSDSRTAVMRTVGQLLIIEETLGGAHPYAVATLSSSRKTVTNPVRRLIITEIVGALVTLALAVAFTLWGLRAAFAPLRHVGAVAASIAAGDHRIRLHPRRPRTELGQMAAAFDTMVDALEAAIEQARHSEGAMRRFIADASHELRTPIAALQATAETLLREQPPRPQRDTLEAHLAREAAQLGRLVDDLLNLARLEASEPLQQERVDLSDIAQYVAAETASSAPQATITVTHKGDTEVFGDADALARAVRNLLDNAVAATDRKGHIRISVAEAHDLVVTSVLDDGPGISAMQRERVLQGFVRLPGAKGDGVGLGLAIATRIAHQHAGTLTCEDAHDGARFDMRIPKARAASIDA